jgi:hypothetical protein
MVDSHDSILCRVVRLPLHDLSGAEAAPPIPPHETRPQRTSLISYFFIPDIVESEWSVVLEVVVPLSISFEWPLAC